MVITCQKGQWVLKDKTSVYKSCIFCVLHLSRSCSFFRVMVKDRATQGPDIVFNFALMVYNQGKFFPCYHFTALRRVLKCASSKGFYWLAQHSTRKISHLGLKCSESFDKSWKRHDLNFLWLIKSELHPI